MQVELERSGDVGMMLDDAGGFDLMDDERLMMAGPGPAGMMGRPKRCVLLPCCFLVTFLLFS